MTGLFQGLMSEDAYQDRISGVTTGTVKENWDSEHKGMVKVEMILGENGKNLTGWVPVMSPYAGKEYGQYALPEVGSEVVIAFNMGNRNCPIVIGCLWNQNNTLPSDAPQEKNTIKEFKTKGGNKICIQDEGGKEKITISTKGGLTTELDDEKKTIVCKDKDGKNKIEMNAEKGAMSFTAAQKMTFSLGSTAVLSMDGNAKSVTLESGKITVKGSQTLDLQGQSTNVKGSMVNIKGDSTLKAESGSMTQIKGAMVKIN